MPPREAGGLGLRVLDPCEATGPPYAIEAITFVMFTACFIETSRNIDHFNKGLITLLKGPQITSSPSIAGFPLAELFGVPLGCATTIR